MEASAPLCWAGGCSPGRHGVRDPPGNAEQMTLGSTDGEVTVRGPRVVRL